jgi:hypothetical protein
MNLEQATAGRDSLGSGRTAFRSFANADEDWTKIGDPTERRRLQNRIAQRKYRTLFPQKRPGKSRGKKLNISQQAASFKGA